MAEPGEAAAFPHGDGDDDDDLNDDEIQVQEVPPEGNDELVDDDDVVVEDGPPEVPPPGLPAWAAHVEPIPDVQSKFTAFDRFRNVDYHTRVWEQTFNCTKTCVLGVLLKCSLPKGNELSVGKRTFTVTNGKAKYDSMPSRYRRLYTFANANSAGHTFVYMELGTKCQLTQLKHFDTSRIGDLFVIIEPATEVSYISRKMPILKTDYAIIPVRYKVGHRLPIVDITDDGNMNSSKFFVIHNANLKLGNVNLIAGRCTSGNMCDLQKLEDNGCSCWHQHNRGFVDAEHALKCQVMAHFRTEGGLNRKIRVSDWSSLNFTRFVFNGRLPLEPLIKDNDQIITDNIRYRLENLLDYVNEQADEANRGWTIIGWYRRAYKADASGVQDDKVATALGDCTYHIVRIQPTRVTREQLLEADELLPVDRLGAHANLDMIRTENEAYAAAQDEPH